MQAMLGNVSRKVGANSHKILSSNAKTNHHPHRTGAAPCWVALIISTAGHVWTWPGPVTFPPQNCRFACGDLGPQQIVVPSAHLSSQSKRHLDRFSHFCRACGHDRQTDRPCYSVCSNRTHLARAATRPKNGTDANQSTYVRGVGTDGVVSTHSRLLTTIHLHTTASRTTHILITSTWINFSCQL